jgi:hypothetical protein
MSHLFTLGTVTLGTIPRFGQRQRIHTTAVINNQYHYFSRVYFKKPRGKKGRFRQLFKNVVFDQNSSSRVSMGVPNFSNLAALFHAYVPSPFAV